MTIISKRATIMAVAAVMLGATTLSLASMLTTWAEPDTTSLTFSFNVTETDEAPGISLAAYDDGKPLETGKAGVELRATVEGSDRMFEFMPQDSSTGEMTNISNDRTSVTCNSDKSCVMTISGVDVFDNAYQIIFRTPGDAPIGLLFNQNNNEEYHGDPLNDSATFTVFYDDSRINNFDGGAYVIWACGENDSEVCLHLIEGIQNENGETEYYNANSITNITDGRTFDQFGNIMDEDRARGMALKKDVDAWVLENYNVSSVNEVNWSNVDIHQFLRGKGKGDYEAELIENGTCSADMDEDTLHGCVDDYFEEHNLSETMGVKLQPLSDEKQGPHSYMSFGDRRFKIVIYEDGYKAIELGDTEDMTYVPYTMTDDVYVSAIDISETTAERPAEMDSLLLENIITFDALTYGGLNIESVEALDVPDGAVTVTGSDGSYQIRFNSNFYDSVIFKITDADGQDYYLRINRAVLYPRVEDRGDQHNVYTKFFFDENNNHSDYEVVAAYAYKDGTIQLNTMPNRGKIACNISDICPGDQISGGRGLKMSDFSIEEEPGFADNLEGVYFNVKRAGSTDTTYAGTLTGSGIGQYIEIEHERR